MGVEVENNQTTVKKIMDEGAAGFTGGRMFFTDTWLIKKDGSIWSLGEFPVDFSNSSFAS